MPRTKSEKQKTLNHLARVRLRNTRKSQSYYFNRREQYVAEGRTLDLSTDNIKKSDQSLWGKLER
jgi:hypothetical protein